MVSTYLHLIKKKWEQRVYYNCPQSINSQDISVFSYMFIKEKITGMHRKKHHYIQVALDN